MFDKLKKAANTAAESVSTAASSAADAVSSAASNAAGAVSSVASNAANTAAEMTRNQYQTQIDNVISLMEMTALRAQSHKSIKDFQVSATLNLGIASIQLSVHFDLAKIAAEEVVLLENPATPTTNEG